MQIKFNLNKYINLIFIILFITCGLGNAFLCSRLMDLRQYRIVSQLVSQADMLDPQFSQTLILSLKHADEQAVSAGGDLLKLYGYRPEVFFPQNFTYFALFCLMLSLVFALLFVSYRRHEECRRQKRIEELILYLETSVRGGEGLLSSHEDEFSLLEDRLFKTVTELKETREQALEERRSLAVNLADIAHQLKTPITSMSLMAQLLSDNCNNAAAGSSAVDDVGRPQGFDTAADHTSNSRLRNDPKTDLPLQVYENLNYVNKITAQLSRLEGLVTSLLTISRLDAGTLILKKSPLDASAVLTLAAESLEPVFVRRSQTFTLITENRSIFIGDQSWTAEALINILKNCSEHTPVGGSVSAVCSSNPLYAQIVIEDSGSGFDPEDLPRLFQRFYRGKNAAADSAGIGLALARSIIEQQDGTIKAENRSEGGARFLIKFYR